MSIVALSDDTSQSHIEIEDLHGLAASLNFKITNDKDAGAYLLMLRSFESVMQHVEKAPDYIHPSLAPQDVLGGQTREYHKPDPSDNPMNAWSHCCNLAAARPTSDLLKGRSVVIKDSISVGGLPTTLGTHPEILSKDGELPVSPIDATVVSRLLGAGAVIKGTSTCENFCASPLSWTSASGPVHHPLLQGYTAGGSSSGSCALVAANALVAVGGEDGNDSYESFGPTVELAIGTDQAGSVRNPACYTGLYGLKPTFGLVPYTGAASMSPMIDHLGPIASSLEDVAVLLKVMAGWDGLDPRMTPESPTVDRVPDYPALLASYRASLLKQSDDTEPVLKVGLLTEAFSVSGLSPEVAELIKQTTHEAFATAGNASVTTISVPMHTEGPVIWTAATRPSMSQWLSQGRPSGHLSYLAPHIAPQWPPDQRMYELLNVSNPALVNIHLSGALASSAHDSRGCMSGLEAKAHRKVFELRAAYDRALEEVDVLVLPCTPTVSMPHPPDPDTPLGENNNGARILDRLAPAVGLTSNTCPFNVTGHPAMSVPCGTLPVFVEVSGKKKEVQMPVGMQIVGRRWDDVGVLKAAALFEAGKKRIS
ncbi:amidase signature domain-containing protein [Microdochium trichocladiopsis]|uniref:Amidase signature domain-containing protein n=1 Tax=Microdochium trichocladiopsis TaxID=1682393 RepID=A0A9P8XWB4_9PEZI|nr:amidase signature domain-containing protein [Microdochium trichocladiopsis]KAH7024419.1 amidase signature domain-containing protein [Microdochium trichocladiopsis]